MTSLDVSAADKAAAVEHWYRHRTVEHGWRDLKQVIDLRPACHRKEERIRAHVILCWLAPSSWPASPRTPAAPPGPNCGASSTRITVGTFSGPAGTFRQRTEISPAQQDILDQLGIDPPPRIYQITPVVSR